MSTFPFPDRACAPVDPVVPNGMAKEIAAKPPIVTSRPACGTIHLAAFSSLVAIVGLALVSNFITPTSQAAEIEGLPVPTAPHRAVVGTPVEQTLPNGLRVIVLERPGLPVLSADLIVRGGVETDPPQLSGLTRFTAALLKRGTKTRNAMQIAEDIESLGAKIEDEANWDFTALSLSTLSANAEPALALLAELAREPVFAKDEIERLRLESLDELRMSLEEPGTVGRLAAVRATLPADARPAAGTLASVARFTAKDIAAQHARLFRPDHCLLVLAGNIPAADTFALVQKLFGSWTVPATAPAAPAKATAKSKAKALPAASAPPAALTATTTTSPRVVLVDMPNAGQAAVYLAAPSITRGADDWFAGKVTSTVLGGGYSSRLNEEIRVKRGLSYGAGSSLSTRRTSGIFLASAQTKNESALEVVKLMQTEIARLAGEPVPLDYLQTRQSVLTGALSRDLETNAKTVNRLGELALYDLPLDGLNQYFDNIDRIKAEDLQTFSKAHLPVDAFTIVIAGQAKIIEAPLRAAFPKLEVIPVAKLDLDSPTLLSPKAKK